LTFLLNHIPVTMASEWIPPHYKNLGKKVKDLLGKTFTIKNEIKTINKSPNGVKLETSFGGDKDISGTVKGSCKVAGNYDLEGVFMTKGEVNVKAAAKKLKPGLELTLQGKSLKQQVIFDAKFAQPFYACATAITHTIDSQKTVLDGSLMIGFDGLSVGFSGQVDVLAKEQVTDYNCGAEFTDEDLTVSLFTEKTGNVITASYWQKISGACNLGASLKMDPDVSKGDTNSKPQHILTVGTQYKLDANTDIAIKGDTAGVVCANIDHVLASPAVKLGIGASFDSNKTSNLLAADKFGICCTFGDF